MSKKIYGLYMCRDIDTTSEHEAEHAIKCAHGQFKENDLISEIMDTREYKKRKEKCESKLLTDVFHYVLIVVECPNMFHMINIIVNYLLVHPKSIQINFKKTDEVLIYSQFLL